MIKRPIYQFPGFFLSIQVAFYCACEPRENLPNLSSYLSVEVALRTSDDGVFITPGVLGLSEFNNLWEEGNPVGEEIPYHKAMELLGALTEKYGMPEMVMP